jgi:hypothetical protein
VPDRGRFLVIASVAVLLAAAMPSPAINASADPVPRPEQVMDPPVVQVFFTPDRKDALAEPGQDVSVEFSGFLKVTQSRSMTSTTSVLVTMSKGWPAVASPAVFTKTGTFEDNFLISVQVPHEARAHEVSEMVVTATAVASGQDLVEASARGHVGVEQYHGVSISCRNPHSEIRRDDTAYYVCRVQNFGNGLTNVHVRSDDPVGGAVLIKPEVVDVGPWDESEVTIALFFDPDVPPGVYKVVITAEVMNDVGGVATSDEVELTVEILTWFESTPAVVLSIYSAVLLATGIATVLVFRRWRSRRGKGAGEGEVTQG